MYGIDVSESDLLTDMACSGDMDGDRIGQKLTVDISKPTHSHSNGIVKTNNHNGTGFWGSTDKFLSGMCDGISKKDNFSLKLLFHLF